jgi:Rad3-related DNA helicase
MGYLDGCGQNNLRVVLEGNQNYRRQCAIFAARNRMLKVRVIITNYP